MLYDPLRYGVLSSDDRYSFYYIILPKYELFYFLKKSVDFYFRWTDLRQDFKKMPEFVYLMI